MVTYVSLTHHHYNSITIPFTYIHTPTHTCTYTHTCMCTYTHTYTCIDTHTHAGIHTHTHEHHHSHQICLVDSELPAQSKHPPPPRTPPRTGDWCVGEHTGEWVREFLMMMSGTHRWLSERISYDDEWNTQVNEWENFLWWWVEHTGEWVRVLLYYWWVEHTRVSWMSKWEHTCKLNE